MRLLMCLSYPFLRWRVKAGEEIKENPHYTKIWSPTMKGATPVA